MSSPSPVSFSVETWFFFWFVFFSFFSFSLSFADHSHIPSCSPLHLASPLSHCAFVTHCLPFLSVEIKFLDVPEAGYLATNNPPQGEILVRGASITGYYKCNDLIHLNNAPRLALCRMTLVALRAGSVGEVKGK
jgi:hypothetical protein